MKIIQQFKVERNEMSANIGLITESLTCIKIYERTTTLSKNIQTERIYHLCVVDVFINDM